MKKIILKTKKLINTSLSKFGYTVIKKKPTIVEISNEERNIIDLCRNFSMTPDIRMWGLINSLKKILYQNIEGDIVECGIWKGGNIILIKKLLDKYNSKKNIYCFDTFEGMNDTTEIDKELSTNISAKEIISDDEYFSCKSSFKETESNIKKNVDNMKNIFFIKGKVEDTLEKDENIPNKISLCRLDTDYYSSTKIELEKLYSRISTGGILIIDDYGHWSGSKKAVDEFFKDKFVMKHYIDYACRLIIKEE